MEEFVCVPTGGEETTFRVKRKQIIDAGGDKLSSTYWDRRAVGVEYTIEVAAPYDARAPEQVWRLIENNDHVMRTLIDFAEQRKYLTDIARKAIPSRPTGLDGGPHLIKQLYRALQSWFYRTSDPSWRLIVIEDYNIESGEQMTCLGTTATKVVLEINTAAYNIPRIFVKEPLSAKPQMHIPEAKEWWPTDILASTVVLAWLAKPVVGAIELLPAVKAIKRMKAGHEYRTIYQTRYGAVVLYLTKQHKTTHT